MLKLSMMDLDIPGRLLVLFQIQRSLLLTNILQRFSKFSKVFFIGSKLLTLY